MHILGILMFVLALIVAGEVIRSTLVASGAKIFSALAGQAVEPVIGLIVSDRCETVAVTPITCAERRRVVSRPVWRPVAA